MVKAVSDRVGSTPLFFIHLLALSPLVSYRFTVCFGIEGEEEGWSPVHLGGLPMTPSFSCGDSGVGERVEERTELSAISYEQGACLVR